MKIATSLLAATALAGPNPTDFEISALRSGCDRLIKSSAFNGKKRPKLSNAKWQQKWSLKCEKQQTRKEMAYKRCGEYVAGYSVTLTKDVETEACEAISELASENIRWVDAHIVDTLCAGRVQKITKRMEQWEGKLRALIDCPAAGGAGDAGGSEGAGEDPTHGYLTNVPAGYAPFDYTEESYDDYPDYFNAGDNIILSKRCILDFNTPKGGYGCVDRIGDATEWDRRVVSWCQNAPKEHLLSEAAKDSVHPEQYLTMLNCPQCGCTHGEYDAPEIDSDRSKIGTA